LNFLGRLLLFFWVLISVLTLSSIHSEASSAWLKGYEAATWGSSVESIIARYPKGHLGKMADEVIYRQFNPTARIARRNFAFNSGKLHTVTVIYAQKHIEKYGIDKLLQDFNRLHGEGVMDVSQAPHMLSCTWEAGEIKVTLAYAPKRPDMTVAIYQKSNKVETGPRVNP
jgi:hypothetical protein